MIAIVLTQYGRSGIMSWLSLTNIEIMNKGVSGSSQPSINSMNSEIQVASMPSCKETLNLMSAFKIILKSGKGFNKNRNMNFNLASSTLVKDFSVCGIPR